MIDLRPTRNTSLIELRVVSDKPDEAAKIANAIAKTYQEHRKDARRLLTQSGITTFEKKLKEYDAELKDREKKVDSLRQESGIMDTDPQSTGPGQTLGPVNVLHYNSLKIENEAQYLKEAELLKQLKQLEAKDLRQAIPTAAPDSILASLLQDLISAQAKLVALRSDYGPKTRSAAQ